MPRLHGGRVLALLVALQWSVAAAHPSVWSVTARATVGAQVTQVKRKVKRKVKRRGSRSTRRRRTRPARVKAAPPPPGDVLAPPPAPEVTSEPLPSPPLPGNVLPPPATPQLTSDPLAAPEATSSPESAPPLDSPPSPADDGWDVPEATFAELPAVPQRVLEVGGRVRTQYFAPLREAEPDKWSGRTEIAAALRVQVTQGSASARASLLARQDYANPARNRFDAEEAYARIEKARLRVSAGRMFASWGAATLLNPTDVLNPIDLRDLRETEKVGAWMVRGDVLLGRSAIELYFLPVPEPHWLPEFQVREDGALVSRSPWVVGALPQPGPLPLRYRLDGMGAPPPRPENVQAAARFTSSLGNADFSLGYAYLFDHLPNLQLALEPGPASVDALIQVDYPRMHIVTGDVERAFGKLRVAGEGVLFMRDRRMPDGTEDAFTTYVAGADLVTGPFLVDHTLHVFLEYTDTVALRGKLREDFLGQIRYPLRNAVLARATYASGASWSASVTAAYAFGTRDLLLEPEVAVRVADGVQARLGGLYLGGDPDTGFFASLSRNNRIQGTLEALF